MRTLGLGNFCPACQAHSTEEARRSQWPIVGMLIGPANLPWGSPVQPVCTEDSDFGRIGDAVIENRM